MASKPVKMETEAEQTKALLSTIAHLIGLKEGRDGKLEVMRPEENGRRREVINIENLSSEHAQQWRPGALLDTVADLGIIPQPEVAKIREKLQIRKGSPRPPPPASAPAPGASSSRGNNSVGVKTGGNQRPNYKFPVDSPPPMQKPGFLPPRRLQAGNSGAGAASGTGTNQARSEPVSPKGKSFAFKRSNQDCSNFGSSSSERERTNLYSVPTAPPSKQAAIPASFAKFEEQPSAGLPMFRSATEVLMIEDRKKGIVRNYNNPNPVNANVSGLRRPAKSGSDQSRVARPAKSDDNDPISDNPELEEIMSHECMKNIDPKMVETVLNEVVQIAEIGWDDIAGLEQVKTTIQEIIILPMLRPDLFTGIRSPAKGILFFGPPGTGKTMFGRLIATQSKSSFFNISASSLTSKWIGDGEKMVRALFAVARVKQPSVIFIDEIDSILTQRSDTEHESSRRLKTEFLIQFDGAATLNDDRILVIGVTNRPQELDEAARRRLVKRIYIPLPDSTGRKQIVMNLMRELSSSLEEKDYDSIGEMTVGYSGADMNSLCKEAALGPLRDVPRGDLQNIHASQVRSIQMKDFISAQKVVKSSVAESDVTLYEDWNEKFGCHS